MFPTKTSDWCALQAGLFCVILIGCTQNIAGSQFWSINRAGFVISLQFLDMARMKKMTHHIQPEPNLFLQQTPSMMSEAETHVITTSTPASPDEPQPALPQEESQQQPQEVEAPENVPKLAPSVLVIQP